MDDTPRFREVRGPTFEEIDRLKRDLARTAQAEQMAYSRIEAAEQEAGRWRARARFAVERGDQDLARAALERAARYDEQAAQAKANFLEIAEHVAAIKERLHVAQSSAPVGGTRLVADIDPLVERFQRLEQEQQNAELAREVARLRAELAAKEAGGVPTGGNSPDAAPPDGGAGQSPPPGHRPAGGVEDGRGGAGPAGGTTPPAGT